MYLGTNVTPPVIHPTTNIVNHTFSSTVVPHIHPVHTTTVNHHMYQHKHYCPQSASCCEEVCNQHINCCSPCGMPGAVGPMANAPMGAGPMGPGPMGAGPMGPGPMGAGPMGPGPMGPGFY
ncbi:spore coat protein CotD [Neobacillus cucumis]|uniref:CotD family spore coat protein n=1 Tax=Neobacillus cucumis TaxID=1740721 RepID=UPI0018E0393A|nr:CotD family spore coat protein [Neobacillus cucumis]MBI0576091.1 spore coat protein CotD [Neobacillus cucumis]WHY90280.1 CotD family spore coat protein [Neobacillus cucumis]